jgi:hypothetical protein
MGQDFEKFHIHTLPFFLSKQNVIDYELELASENLCL